MLILYSQPSSSTFKNGQHDADITTHKDIFPTTELHVKIHLAPTPTRPLPCCRTKINLWLIIIIIKIFQRRYILKFATDGAVLTNTKNAVQAAIKLIPADSNGKIVVNETAPAYLDKEIMVYYFIGKYFHYAPATLYKSSL